jgi:hypothetical protein
LPETTINKVIGIMRDAASQLTDKVEFLGMPKHYFRLAAAGLSPTSDSRIVPIPKLRAKDGG